MDENNFSLFPCLHIARGGNTLIGTGTALFHSFKSAGNFLNVLKKKGQMGNG